ncbi:hypothetical protein CIB48_g8561 [Xylaria polymorpha]|nr:hypothetical protein CIB48_g8561 [Xylaria polymorpha]
MGESHREDDKTYDNHGQDQDPALKDPDSKAACPTQKMSNEQQGESGGKVSEPQNSGHPISDDKPQESTAEFLSGMSIEWIIEALMPFPEPPPDPRISTAELEREYNKRLNSMRASALAKTTRLSELPEQADSDDAEVSLRGGGLDDDDDEWPYHQRHHHNNDQGTPTRPQRHVRFVSPSSSTPEDATRNFPKSPSSVVFPGMVSASDYPPTSSSNNSTKRKASNSSDFATAATNFQMLPLNVQLRTLNYLRGDPATGWAYDLGLPLMDMFQQLRACVLLLCEDENPALARDVLRDGAAYARFRDGLNPNFLAPDDDAGGSCWRFGRWIIRLCWGEEEGRELGEEDMASDDDAAGGEDVVDDDDDDEVDGDKENVRPRSLGLGDLDMST